MPWFKEVCEDAICGGALGIVKGVCGLSLFTASETEEIMSLKKLTPSLLSQSKDIFLYEIID